MEIVFGLRGSCDFAQDDASVVILRGSDFTQDDASVGILRGSDFAQDDASVVILRAVAGSTPAKAI